MYPSTQFRYQTTGKEMEVQPHYSEAITPGAGNTMETGIYDVI